MYVAVIPAIRSLRGKDWFTYSVPSGSNYQIGEVVRIPWRSASVIGVVHAITDTAPEFKTKPVLASIGVVLPKPYLDFIYWFSQHYHIALTSTIKLVLPSAPKRHKAKSITVHSVVKQTKLAIEQQPRTIIFSQPKEAITLIQALMKQAPHSRGAIIVPEEWQLNWLNQTLTLPPTSIITGTTSTGKLWRAWLAMLAGEAGWWLGTKRLSLFPLHQLDYLIILSPEHESHKQWDLNPRYHTWSIMRYWKEQQPQLDVVALSESPRVDQTLQTKINISQAKFYTPAQITLLPLANQAVPDSHGLVSYSLLERCARDQTIFLWLNKKGEGKLLLCQDCKHIWSDLTVTRCPKCRGVNIRSISHGTTSLVKVLRQLLPDRPVIELTQDSATTTLDLAQHPIIVGTNYAYQYLDWKHIDAIAVVAIDWLLAQPHWRAHETVLQALVYLRNRTSQLCIQTYVPDHPVFKALLLFFPEAWYQEQLAERKRYQLPPFGDYILARPGSERAETWHQVKTLPSNANWIIDRE